MILLSLLIDTALKATVLLALAAAAALACRRASAAARHLLWTAAILGLFFLPLISWTLPAWRILPAWAQWSPPTLAATPTLPNPPRSPLPITPISAPTLPLPTADPLTPIPAQPLHQSAQPPQLPITNYQLQPPLTPRSAPLPSPIPTTLPTALLCTYSLGTAAMLLPFLLSLIALRLTARRARPADAAWSHALAQLRAHFHIRRPVRLAQSTRRSVPMTFGILHPTILIPKNAWPADRRRIVLLHELAHIQRHDCLTLLLARLARALLWFHPLVWLAARQLALEAERACDDLVLSAGTRSSDYASELLTIATSLQPHPPHPVLAAAALTMARPSTLETRLRAILDFQRNRRAVTRTSILLITAMALTIILPLASMRSRTPALHSVVAVDRAPIEWVPLSPPISLDVKDASLEDLAGAMAKATGVPIRMPVRNDPALWYGPFTLTAKDRPLWEVMEALNAHGPVYFTFEGSGLELSTHEAQRGGVAVNGFYVYPYAMVKEAKVNDAALAHKVLFAYRIMPDPQLWAVAATSMGIWDIKDNLGNVLAITREAQSPGDLRPGYAWGGHVYFDPPAEGVTSVSVKGEARFLVGTGEKRYEVGDIEAMRQPLELSRQVVRVDGGKSPAWAGKNFWLHISPKTPEEPGKPPWPLRIVLIDGTGAQVWGASLVHRPGVAGDYWIGGRGLFEPLVFKAPLKMVVTEPTGMTEVVVPFEMKDVALPEGRVRDFQSEMPVVPPAAATQPAATQAAATTTAAEKGWGEAGNNGLRIRLVLPSKAAAKPVLATDAVNAHLEIWNTSDKKIAIGEQNLTGGTEMVADEWLIGLSITVIDPQRGARIFHRADDGTNRYWSEMGNSPGAQEIAPGGTAAFGIRLHKLVDSDGTNLLSLRGDYALQPVLDVGGGTPEVWHGMASGKEVPVLIAAAAAAIQPTPQPATQPATQSGAAATIRGQVLDKPGGRPVAGVVVALLDMTKEDKLLQTALSDGQGRYVFQGVSSAAESYVVQVGDERRKGAELSEDVRVNVSEKDAAARAELAAAPMYTQVAELTGRAIDVETGKAVPGVRFLYTLRGGDPHETMADAQGVYRLNVTARSMSIYCDGTHDRYYSVEGKKTIDMSDGRGRVVDFKLQSAPVYTGRVVGPDGKPMAGAKVIVQPWWDRTSSTSAKLLEAAIQKYGAPPPIQDDERGRPTPHGVGQTFHTTTDAQGLFQLYLRHPYGVPDRPSGIVIEMVAASADQSLAGIALDGTSTLDPVIPRAEVRLSPAAALELTVVDALGAKVTDAVFEYSIDYAGTVNMFENEPEAGTWENFGDGRYRVRGLVAGYMYNIYARNVRYTSGASPGYTLTPGETAARELRLSIDASPDSRPLKGMIRPAVTVTTLPSATADDLHDLAALRTAIKPLAGWTIQSREGTLAPYGLAPAHGIELTFPPAKPPAGKFVPLTLWIMDPDYSAAPAPPSTQPSSPVAGTPRELARWNGHRVFLFDNYDQAWPNATADIQAALTATNSTPPKANTSVPFTRPAPAASLHGMEGGLTITGEEAARLLGRGIPQDDLYLVTFELTVDETKLTKVGLRLEDVRHAVEDRGFRCVLVKPAPDFSVLMLERNNSSSAAKDILDNLTIEGKAHAPNGVTAQGITFVTTQVPLNEIATWRLVKGTQLEWRVLTSEELHPALPPSK